MVDSALITGERLSTENCMQRIRRFGLVLLCASQVCAASVHAQVLKPITLKPATATLDFEFDGLTSVRELSDGRAIVTDGGAQKPYLVDFSTNTATVLGRIGKGPGEWTHVGLVYSIGNDSTVMHDMASRRWLLFGKGKIGSTIPPDNPAVKATQGYIDGADELGHVLVKRGAPPRNGETELTRKDSIAVVLVNRATAIGDTVAKVRVAPHIWVYEADSLGTHKNYSKPTEANAQEEAVALAPDGTLALLRMDPLRVDWRSPTGQWTKGPPLPLLPDAVNARERKAIQDRYKKALSAYNGDPRLRPAPPMIPSSYNVWTPIRGLFIASDGRLIMRRTTTASIPAKRYVVVNRRGTIDGQFTLGENEDIVGFGPKYLYVLSRNEDDIQTLRRHPWP